MNTVIRVAVIYLVVMIGLRIIGKRELSQLAPRELVMLLLIPELFSQAALGEDFSMTNAMIAFVTLLVLVFWTSVLTYLSPSASRLVDATPAVLVRRGEIVDGALDRERITIDEVFSEIRHVGLTDLAQVEWAILEGDGKISIVPVHESERYQRREDNAAPV